MLRRFVIAAALVTYLAIDGSVQGAPVTPPNSDAGRSVARKPAKPGAVLPAESGPCHIGVIPIAGDLFRVETYGFGGRSKRVATEGWALDELVVSRVRAAAPGYSVRRIPFTREELFRDAKLHPRTFFHRDTIKGFTERFAGRINCQRYVVAYRTGGEKEFGIGISNHTLINKAYLYAMLYIRVYDGRTFDVIKQGAASLEEGNFSLLASPQGPHRKLDPSAFPDKPEDAARNPMFREGVRALLTQSLDNTLPAMLKQ